MAKHNCIVCGKKAKKESINGVNDVMSYYMLCAPCNEQIELDTIQELIDKAISQRDELNKFINSCEYFKNNV